MFDTKTDIRILLCGYYFQGNTGDDLLMESIVKTLSKYGEVRVTSTESFNTDLLDWCQVLVIGGGSLITPRGIGGYQHAKYAKENDKKVVYYSQTIEEGHPQFREHLARADLITVRDAQSKRVVEANGFRAVLASDPLFKRKRRTIGCSFRRWVNEPPGIVKRLASVLDDLAIDYDILLLPFTETDTDTESDTAFHEEIIHSMQKKPRQAAYAEAIENVDLLIGMRLHALIHAINIGKKVLAIDYDAKIRRILSDLAMEDFVVPYEEVDRIPQIVRERIFKSDGLSLREKVNDALIARICADIKGEPKALVSVVMPTYNRAKYLREAMESILEQTMQDWELILIDDGSSDSTRELVESYNDERIEYYNFGHNGISFSRNIGNLLSRGEIIVVADSDDINLPNRLEVTYEELQRTGADILYASMLHFDDRGEREFLPSTPFSEEKLRGGNFIYHPTVAYRREVAVTCPYDEHLDMVEDYHMYLQAAEKGYKFCQVEIPLTRYRRHETQISAIRGGEMEEMHTQLVRIAHLEAALKDKAACIAKLEHAVKDKEVHIANLEAALKDKAACIAKLEHAVKDKEVHIANLEAALREKEFTLNQIYRSHGWKALSAYYRAIDKSLPLGSRRRKAAVSLRKSIGTIMQDREFPGFETKGRVVSEQELISVVIPVYDRTDMLVEGIESILRQTYQKFELLLVCDGSPAETLKIVDSYESHPQVRVFRYKDNSGSPVRGRNKGIREAKGKYVVFQDSDDIAEPNRLEISYRYAKEHNADVVYGMWRVRKERDASDDHTLPDDQIVHSPDCDYHSLKQGTNFLCQSTVMVSMEALRKAGGLKPEMRYCEDYELWLRLAYLGCEFKSIPEVLATLRLHSNNLESKFREEKEAYVQKAIAEHKTIPEAKPSIAFFIPGEGISGGIMVLCQHANRLVKKGYDVVFVNTNQSDPFKLDWFPNLLPEIIPINKMDRNVDIAVATQWTTAFPVRDFPARRKLYFVQSDETRFYPSGSEEAKLARETYNFDFEYIVIARWLEEWLRDSFGKSAHYVPNGLDTSIFFPDKPSTPKNAKLRVLLEGPIDIPFKGMDQAFQIVDGLDCEVWCVSSSGRPKPGWRCDRFFEKVPLEMMREIYSSCDVLVKMSKVEGFFMPPLEMMACGGTVITGKVTGYDEYIVDGHNALVVEQGDVESAKEKLRLLINDRHLLHRLIKGGLDTVKKWTWTYSNDQLEKVIKKELQAD